MLGTCFGSRTVGWGGTSQARPGPTSSHWAHIEDPGPPDGRNMETALGGKSLCELNGSLVENTHTHSLSYPEDSVNNCFIFLSAQLQIFSCPLTHLAVKIYKKNGLTPEMDPCLFIYLSPALFQIGFYVACPE